ncbi:MAG: pentapeptide repeat-containing protein [Halobacteriaceae archaeon]
MTDGPREESLAVLDLEPDEREARDAGPDAVHDALRDVVEHGDRSAKVLEGCSLPALSFDYETLDGADNHPLVFRDCEVGELSLDHADLRVGVRFEDCTVAGLSLDGATVESDLAAPGTRFTGPVVGEEAHFARDADFSDATFAGPVTLDEAWFGDDTSFEGAVFRSPVSVRGAAFHGTSNDLDDNADFAAAHFEDEADFRQAAFEFATFADATFDGAATFLECRFRGDVSFTGATFAADADFDEVTVTEDASFEDTTFAGVARFRGAVFEGGARSLQDDATFAGARFREPVNFRSAHFRYVTFDDATFGDSAQFEAVRVDADADFTDVDFAAEADFDEARFGGDADFTGTVFEAAAVFRGAAFEGEARHLERSAVFAEATFHGAADFDEAAFTSADFHRARFGGVVDFAGATFEELEFLVESIDGDAYVDFTDAVLKEGSITQPEGSWVRFDLTAASVGDVALGTERPGGRHELLDYVRFCATEFDEFDGYEFDFSAHLYYFERNDWDLHTFDDADPDREYAVPMTPANVETTYLKAKNAASAGGYVKAAGEFRVQRQRFAREKHLQIARDRDAAAGDRLRSASRAAENVFLDVTCGYGMRLGRIVSVFLVAPIVPALLYTFGGRPFLTGAGQLASVGALATAAGRATFFENLHFSYITFLTIGYGGIGPKGALARLLAGLEVYVSVILGGLVLYALIKRSEL